MAQNPKFKPQETPLTNYNQGAIAWSYFKVNYADPLGPRTGQYDPYYMYSVDVELGENWIPHTWFTSIEDHIRLQVAGATKDTVLKATYVMDQKRRALVVQYMSGPMIARDESEVRKQVTFAVSQVENEGSYGSSFDNDNVANPPAPPPASTTAQVAPPDPFSNKAPVMPAQQATQPTAQPVTPPTWKPSNGHGPDPNLRNYMPFNQNEKEAWKARFRDIAELQLYAYNTVMEIGKELDIKVKAADQRELATSASIQTWREFSSKGGLYGWTFIPPVEPLTADTQDNALRKIDTYTIEHFQDKSDFIKTWLADVALPVDGIDSWKHAANIAALLGVESEIVYNDFDTDAMLVITQAIWAYQGCRDEGMTRNESLEFVAGEYDLPLEVMQFEEEEEAVSE